MDGVVFNVLLIHEKDGCFLYETTIQTAITDDKGDPHWKCVAIVYYVVKSNGTLDLLSHNIDKTEAASLFRQKTLTRQPGFPLKLTGTILKAVLVQRCNGYCLCEAVIDGIFSDLEGRESSRQILTLYWVEALDGEVLFLAKAIDKGSAFDLFKELTGVAAELKAVDKDRPSPSPQFSSI